MKKIIISSLAVAAILVGCNQAQSQVDNNGVSQNQQVKKDMPKKEMKKVVPQKTVKVTGIREASLNADSQNLEVVKYNPQAPIPGKVKLYKKSYFTAPPMIPHSTAGMTPITIKNNQCLMCHMPQNAKAMHITSIPKDHFVDNFKGNKKRQRIAGSRFNCTTCHAPQATLNPVIENKFKSAKTQAGIK